MTNLATIAQRIIDSGYNLRQEGEATIQFSPDRTIIVTHDGSEFHAPVLRPEWAEFNRRYGFMSFGHIDAPYTVVPTRDGEHVVVRHRNRA